MNIKTISEFTKNSDISAIDKGLLNTLVIAYESGQTKLLNRQSKLVYGRIMGNQMSVPDSIKRIVMSLVNTKAKIQPKPQKGTTLAHSIIKYEDHPEFRAIGKCWICGRELTNEDSIERGIGPVCFDKVGGYNPMSQKDKRISGWFNETSYVMKNYNLKEVVFEELRVTTESLQSCKFDLRHEDNCSDKCTTKYKGIKLRMKGTNKHGKTITKERWYPVVGVVFYEGVLFRATWLSDGDF